MWKLHVYSYLHHTYLRNPLDTKLRWIFAQFYVQDDQPYAWSFSSDIAELRTSAKLHLSYGLLHKQNTVI